MTSHHQNTFSDRKVSNTTVVSTSLNGPPIKPKNSNKIYDISSNVTKKESVFVNQNNKEMVNINIELNKLEQNYQDKKIELDNSYIKLKDIKESYIKKLNELEKTKDKYESLKLKNSNLKLMIMNLMQLKNIIKDK